MHRDKKNRIRLFDRCFSASYECRVECLKHNASSSNSVFYSALRTCHCKSTGVFSVSDNDKTNIYVK